VVMENLRDFESEGYIIQNVVYVYLSTGKSTIIVVANLLMYYNQYLLVSLEPGQI